MLPVRPSAIIACAAARATWKAPLRLVSITVSMLAASWSSADSDAATPALLTTMSKGLVGAKRPVHAMRIGEHLSLRGKGLAVIFGDLAAQAFYPSTMATLAAAVTITPSRARAARRKLRPEPPG